jgi:hypothetical protein
VSAPQVMVALGAAILLALLAVVLGWHDRFRHAWWCIFAVALLMGLTIGFALRLPS